MPATASHAIASAVVDHPPPSEPARHDQPLGQRRVRGDHVDHDVTRRFDAWQHAGLRADEHHVAPNRSASTDTGTSISAVETPR